MHILYLRFTSNSSSKFSYPSLGRLGVRWWVFLGTSYGENIFGKQNLVLYFHFFLVFCFPFRGNLREFYTAKAHDVSPEPGNNTVRISYGV